MNEWLAFGNQGFRLSARTLGALGALAQSVKMKAAKFTKALPALAEVPVDARQVQNLVVGAGPAGYAVVSTLLDAGSQPIAWVDPQFRSGRLASYLDVPSNTEAKLFEKFATTPACASSGAETALEGFKVSCKVCFVTVYVWC